MMSRNIQIKKRNCAPQFAGVVNILLNLYVDLCKEEGRIENKHTAIMIHIKYFFLLLKTQVI